MPDLDSKYQRLASQASDGVMRSRGDSGKVQASNAFGLYDMHPEMSGRFRVFQAIGMAIDEYYADVSRR